MLVVTVGVGAALHVPFGFVSHTLRMRGRAVLPVSAESVMLPPAPTFAVAAAKAPALPAPGMWTIPSPVTVAPRAITSGTGPLEADNEKVLTPTMNGTEPTLAHEKVSRRSSGTKGPVAFMEK